MTTAHTIQIPFSADFPLQNASGESKSEKLLHEKAQKIKTDFVNFCHSTFQFTIRHGNQLIELCQDYCAEWGEEEGQLAFSNWLESEFGDLQIIAKHAMKLASWFNALPSKLKKVVSRKVRNWCIEALEVLTEVSTDLVSYLINRPKPSPSTLRAAANALEGKQPKLRKNAHAKVVDEDHPLYGKVGQVTDKPDELGNVVLLFEDGKDASFKIDALIPAPKPRINAGAQLEEIKEKHELVLEELEEKTQEVNYYKAVTASAVTLPEGSEVFTQEKLAQFELDVIVKERERKEYEEQVIAAELSKKEAVIREKEAEVIATKAENERIRAVELEFAQYKEKYQRTVDELERAKLELHQYKSVADAGIVLEEGSQVFTQEELAQFELDVLAKERERKESEKQAIAAELREKEAAFNAAKAENEQTKIQVSELTASYRKLQDQLKEKEQKNDEVYISKIKAENHQWEQRVKELEEKLSTLPTNSLNSMEEQHISTVVDVEEESAILSQKLNQQEQKIEEYKLLFFILLKDKLPTGSENITLEKIDEIAAEVIAAHRQRGEESVSASPDPHALKMTELDTELEAVEKERVESLRINHQLRQEIREIKEKIAKAQSRNFQAMASTNRGFGKFSARRGKR